MSQVSHIQDRYLTPDPLVKYVKEELKALLVTLNTAVPGVVQSYDVKTNRAVILPAFKIKLRDEMEMQDGGLTDEIPIPPITNVPVLFFGGSNLRISFELKKDDKGVIHFSQRSLDEWKAFLLQNAVPTQHYPKINRKFDMNDGMFMPSIIDKFETGAGTTAGAGGLLGNLLGVATRLTGLEGVSEGLERVGSEIKNLTDSRNELQSQRAGASPERMSELDSQIASLNSQINDKTTENNSLLSNFRGERDMLSNALQSQLSPVVEDVTGQINSLFGELTGLGDLGGFLGGKKTTDVLGGTKINWKGALSAGNENMTLLEAYEDLHSQILDLSNIVLQLTVAIGSALSPPGVTGGPLLSLTEGLLSLSASRITILNSKLMGKILLNRLKLKRMLK